MSEDGRDGEEWGALTPLRKALRVLKWSLMICFALFTLVFAALWQFLSSEDTLRLMGLAIPVGLALLTVLVLEVLSGGRSLREHLKAETVTPTDKAIEDKTDPAETALDLAILVAISSFVLLVIQVIYLELNWLEICLIVLVIVAFSVFTYFLCLYLLKKRLRQRWKVV